MCTNPPPSRPDNPGLDALRAAIAAADISTHNLGVFLRSAEQVAGELPQAEAEQLRWLIGLAQTHRQEAELQIRSAEAEGREMANARPAVVGNLVAVRATLEEMELPLLESEDLVSVAIELLNAYSPIDGEPFSAGRVVTVLTCAKERLEACAQWREDAAIASRANGVRV